MTGYNCVAHRKKSPKANTDYSFLMNISPALLTVVVVKRGSSGWNYDKISLEMPK